jgi:hypothetical protein
MSNQIDSSIPVLTEIIQPDAATFNHISEAVPYAAVALDTTATETNGSSISAEEWQLLEHSLRENVLRQVFSRIDFVLEHRVRDSLADVLQTAVEGLANEIRTGLHKTLEEVITRAVTQEISKAKTLK